MIELANSDSDWPRLFENEAALIKNALGSHLLAIHHIGSTAIPGLIAKPKVDILAIVDNFSAIDFSKLVALGYDDRGEVIPTGRYLSKHKHHTHLHLFEKGNPRIDNHLLFRDYLRTHPKAKEAYAQLKRELAKEHTDGMAYAHAKTAFITAILTQATRMFSMSVERGLSLLISDDQLIYSVGISTAGAAEITMAHANPKRKIIATTLDPGGAAYVETQVKNLKLENQIEVKVEDVSLPLPYKDGTFDFIYARLVLHYLSKNQLQAALQELHRVLKPRRRLFLVVKSNQCNEAKDPAATYNPTTEMTALHSPTRGHYERLFHTPETLQHFLTEAHFHIDDIEAYQELLCSDFNRTKPSTHKAHLLEALAVKA